jgi:gas vesicle protein
MTQSSNSDPEYDGESDDCMEVKAIPLKPKTNSSSPVMVNDGSSISDSPHEVEIKQEFPQDMNVDLTNDMVSQMTKVITDLQALKEKMRQNIENYNESIKDVVVKLEEHKQNAQETKEKLLNEQEMYKAKFRELF